jgi:ABC-type transport system involved in multi-copper enzyme maturation permease subunit
MIKQALTIAKTTFLESLRQPVLMILILLAAALQAFAVANTGFSMGMETATEVKGDNKLLLDLGLATVFVCGTLLAGFIATSAMSREIENKTVLTVVSKPVGRPTLVLGKFLGVSGSILMATLTMLLFLLLAIRHEVMQTAADELDGPVLTFGLSAIFLSLAIATWCNFFYGWSFPQTVVIAVLPLTALAYILVLLVNKDWVIQPIARDFKPQVTLACACLILAILVLCAIAVAASTRLGQVMTIVVCIGVFLGALLSNYVIGRHVFNNKPVGQIREITIPESNKPDFKAPGDPLRVLLQMPPLKAIKPGDSFYYSSGPNGFPMLVPDFPAFTGDPGKLNDLIGAGTPGRIVVTESQDRELTIRIAGENGISRFRAPEPDDYVFLEPTKTNYALLAAWGVIPNLHFFWLLDAVSQNRPVPFEYVATACAYALAQIIAFLSLGIILFQRRDVG